MRMDERLYKAFLEELDALEDFRLSYTAAHPSVPLDREDPDVKRLTEAMAFFGARSRLAAVSHILSLRQRVFRQFFSYLLSPLPVMGLLQASPTGQFVEAVTLPRGTEFVVTTPKNEQAFFQILSDLTILPLFLKGVTMLLRPKRGFRLLMRLHTPYPRNDPIGFLRFHINHLNDFQDSLRVLDALRKHLTRAAVVFNTDADETTVGETCPVSFGPADPAQEEPDGSESIFHPMERERLFFHFPQQELTLNVKCPSPPRNWRHFTLCLDLDDGWPRNLVLNQDIFQLFVVPAANLKRSPAQPITCNGTQEQHPIRYPRPELGCALHSVLGVYRVRKEGLFPLRPGIFSGENGAYEIDRLPGGDRDIHSLLLKLPEAFEHPERLSVEALWHQPWVSQVLSQRLRILPFGRRTAGLDWEWLGPLAAHRENPLREAYEGVAQLLTLMNKTPFNLDDLRALFHAMGSMETGEYSETLRLLSDVSCQIMPRRSAGSGALVKHVYTLTFKEAAPTMQPLLESFSTHAQRILDVWIAEAVVEVRLKTSLAATAVEGTQKNGSKK